MRDTAMRLRHARKARSLTQVKLASISGVKQSSISDLERGESKSFRGSTLVSLAKALQVSPEWLANGKGTMERRDVPLSDEAVMVAADWQRLPTELRNTIANMIRAAAAQQDKMGIQNGDEPTTTPSPRSGSRSRS